MDITVNKENSPFDIEKIRELQTTPHTLLSLHQGFAFAILGKEDQFIIAEIQGVCTIYDSKMRSYYIEGSENNWLISFK